MAARPDQNLKIGLIISVIFVVILGGLSLWMRNEWNKTEARANDLQQQKSSADNAAREKISENEQLLTMLGYDVSSSPSMQDVLDQYDKDKSTYMENFDDSSKNYRTVLDALFAENDSIAQQEAAAKTRADELLSRIVAIEAEKDAQIKKAKEEAAKAQQDLVARTAQYDDDRANLEQQRAELQQSRVRLQEEYEGKLAEASAEVQDVTIKLANSERSRKSLLEQRTLESPTFEVADGRIAYVNQASQTVWVSLGAADSLREQITFSVFESDRSDAAKAEKKGSVEVTRLLGDHLAEARITSDDPRNPILPGDQIYSQLWERGQKLRFALTGVIDLDGDGQSDLQQAKDLIALNGAVVDSSLEEDGTIDGSMSEYTRYLVLGENPTAPSKAAIRKGFQDMSTEAAKWSVETISLAEFLAHIGYRHTESSTDTGKTRRPRSGGRPTSYRFGTP